MIFTLNASNAVKIVGECYPFHNGSLLLLMDNHNSLNGLREYATTGGATSIRYLPVTQPELRATDEELEKYLTMGSSEGHKLFAYPGQSNFSGVQHPLGVYIFDVFES